MYAIRSYYVTALTERNRETGSRKGPANWGRWPPTPDPPNVRVGAQPCAGSQEDPVQVVGWAFASPQEPLVITSYSIHYTKLYDAGRKSITPRAAIGIQVSGNVF